MTSHGAYTKLMTAMRHVRGYAHDSSKNIKAMWAAGPIEEDPKLIEELNDLAERFRSLEAALDEMKDASFRIASQYLKKNKADITKEYELNAGSPSIRTRLKSKADRW